MRTLVIATDLPSASQPLLPPQLESMSTLFIDATVPKGKYRILLANNPTLALEMNTGDDFRVHISELNGASEEQVWKITAVGDARADTKYKIKNRLNCGILGISKHSDKPFVACSLQNYSWTIDSRGCSFIIGDTKSDRDLALGDNNTAVLELHNGPRSNRWLLSPIALFKPTQQYQFQHRQGGLSLDFNYHAISAYGYGWHGQTNQRWNIIDTGKGNYHLKSCHSNLYIGWGKDAHDGATTVMEKTPYCWAVTTLTNGTHQFWAIIDKLAPLGLGNLSGDVLKLSSTPAFWIVTAV